MKKKFMIIAIAAATVCMMAACTGNKPAGNDNGEQSAAVSGTEEAQPQGEVVDDDEVTFVIPEGWAKTQGYKDWNHAIEKKGEKLGSGVHFSVSRKTGTYENLEAVYNDTFDESKGHQAKDPITVGENKFLMYLMPATKAYGDSYIMYTQAKSGKYYVVTIKNSKSFSVTPEDEDIQKLLKSLKLK